MFAGGVTVTKQSFDPVVARLNGALLILASIGLIIPSLYRSGPMAAGVAASKHVSLEIAVILFLVYLGSLVFTLATHKAVVGKAGVQAEKKEAGAPTAEVETIEVHWSRNKALAILAAVTIGLAIMSEVLTGALEPAAEGLGLTALFAGVFSAGRGRQCG